MVTSKCYSGYFKPSYKIIAQSNFILHIDINQLPSPSFFFFFTKLVKRSRFEYCEFDRPNDRVITRFVNCQPRYNRSRSKR